MIKDSSPIPVQVVKRFKSYWCCWCLGLCVLISHVYIRVYIGDMILFLFCFLKLVHEGCMSLPENMHGSFRVESNVYIPEWEKISERRNKRQNDRRLESFTIKKCNTFTSRKEPVWLRRLSHSEIGKNSDDEMNYNAALAVQIKFNHIFDLFDLNMFSC